MTITERRHVVEGHKNGQNFRDVSPYYRTDRAACVARYQARIDNPPKEAWQPTITRITHEERQVTPWVPIS